MAKIRTPRGTWVHAALQALAAGGPDAVRVEALAMSLGVAAEHGDMSRSQVMQLALDRLLQ